MQGYNAARNHAVAPLHVGPQGRAGSPVCQPGRQPGLTDGDRDTVARYAMDELYHATMTSHSGKPAGRCAWVLDEDPDLASLRQHDLFRVFEMVTSSPDRGVR